MIMILLNFNELLPMLHLASQVFEDDRFRLPRFSFAFLYTKGGLWHTPLIDRHLVTFFIPFLPLERSHIRTCIQRQLQKKLENEKFECRISDDDIIDDVLDLIEFSPPDSLLYSVSGCKKVQQKLDFVIESNRVVSKTTKEEL